MSKYIIKNCPATYLNFESKYVCTTQIKQKGFPFYCQDCTDCVLKQIVDKCIKYIENYNDKVFYDEDDVQILMGKVMLSQSILSEILDIQEVE